MLVILSQKVDSESSYADELFNSYHYPARYRNLLHKGDIFIYYQGNRYDKSQRYYFGVGTIGEILTTDGENYYAKLLDCRKFEKKVPIYLPDGGYVEQLGYDSVRKSVNPPWQSSIRPLSQEAFGYILNAAGIQYVPAATSDTSVDELKEQLKQSVRDFFVKELEKNQLLLNTLEDRGNPYRAVFAVDKLNEGWDVLNLFDIVRLYETRDGKNGKPGAGTISEAQLIGRGARYCPFRIDDEQSKYQRKYDNDVDNQLRICETLYYHCWNEPRYISELHTALREVGLDIEGIVTQKYVLKDGFKADELYRSGYIFTNERVLKSRNDVYELLPSVRDKVYEVAVSVGKGGEDVVLENITTDTKVQTFQYITSFSEIAAINYSTINRALRQFDVFKFNVLQSYFPNIKSIRDFVTGSNYLGDIKIKIISKHEMPPLRIVYRACVNVLSKIANKVSAIEEVYEGTKEFKAHKLSEFIRDKSVNYTPVSGGKGVSQNDASVGSNRIDLSAEDWFVFNDNFGTSEEKAFVAYFKGYVNKLQTKYDKIYLVRNERQLHLYSFKGGERFEPDYILYLCKKHTDSSEQLIVFVEPKGNHLLESDKWKEDFLLELKEKAIPVVTFVDDNDYKIWGFHFFNTEYRSTEFAADMATL